MLDKLEKLLPGDWDLVRMPTIGVSVIAGLSIYQNIVAALIGTLTVVYIVLKIYYIRKRGGED